MLLAVYSPQLCRADRLVGQVLGGVGKLPAIYLELEINYFLLRRLLGVKTDDKKQTKVTKLTKGEVLMVNIGSTSTGGKITSVKADLAKITLITPACTDVGEKVALSRRIDRHWRLIGARIFCVAALCGKKSTKLQILTLFLYLAQAGEASLLESRRRTRRLPDHYNMVSFPSHRAFAPRGLLASR